MTAIDLKRFAVPAVCLLVGAAGGGVAGRYLGPTKTVERVIEKVTYKSDEKAISTAVEAAKVEWEKNSQDHTVTKIIYKDGKPVEKIVYVDREVQASGATVKVVEKVVEVEKKVYVDKIVEKEKIVESYRPWIAVEATGAFSLTPAWPPVAWSAMGDIRVFGPVWIGAGVWRDSEWRPAVKARLEF